MKKILLVALLALAATACMLKPLPEVPTLGDVSIPLVENENENWVSSDYANKPVFMVFMGSWCPYCKMTMPAVSKMAEEFSNDVEIVAVFMDHDAETVKNVTKEHNFSVKAAFDADEPAEELGVNGLPHAILFNNKHQLIKSWEGFSPNREEEFREAIQKVLK